jgi:branched-chain amino acid transport system substrate-binding protein
LKTSRRTFIGGASTAALLSASGVAFAQKKYDEGANDKEIKIGHTCPYSGPASAYGVIGKTIEAYWKSVNDAGGINGRMVKFLTRDDGYNPAKTVEMIRELVEQEKVLCTFNTLGTPTNTAIHKYMNQKKVPQLFVATGASKWGKPKEFPWTMGFQPDYHTEGVIYAKHILTNVKDAKVGVLMQNDDYGKDYWDGFKEGLGKESGRVVKHVTYEVTDPTVDSQVIQLKDTGANVFFNIATPKFAAQAIRKAADIGWKPAQYLNNVSASVASTMKPAGFENSQGILTAAYLMDPTDKQWDDHPDMGLDGQVQPARQPDRCLECLRLCRVVPDARDAEEVRRQPDTREPDAAGRQPSEAEDPTGTAGHHRQHQSDRLLSDSGRPAAALPGRDLAPVRRRHARRKLLTSRRARDRDLAPPSAATRKAVSRGVEAYRRCCSACRHSAVSILPFLSRSQRAKLSSPWAMNSDRVTKPSLSASSLWK